MAQVQIYTALTSRPALLDPHIQDGDVMSCMSDAEIEHCHCQRICNPRRIARNAFGNTPTGGLSEALMQNTKEYRMDRISHSEILQTNLWTGATVTFGAVADANGHAIDVPLYVKRRRDSGSFKLFGNTGSEYWYGGHTRWRPADLDAIWAKIEADTPLRRINHQKYPFQANDFKSYLVYPCCWCSEAEATSATAEDAGQDGSGVEFTFRARIKAVDWRSLSGVVEADVTNPATTVDLTDETPQTLSVIAPSKAALSRAQKNLILFRKMRPTISLGR